MLFSIIVPVYNIENWIETCVDSILEQSYEDYEIILVDDGSTDRSGKICDDYRAKCPDKVRVIHKENGGLSDARNFGVAQAKGEYLIFVDGDDYIAPDSLCKIQEIIHRYRPEVILSEGFYRVNEYKEKQLIKKYNAAEYANITGAQTLVKASEKGPNWSAWGKAYSRDYWEKNGYFFVKGRNWEDFQLIDRVVLDAKQVAMTEAFYFYQYRSNSILHAVKAKDLIGLLESFHDWDVYFQEYPVDDEVEKALKANYALLFAQTVMGYAGLVEKNEREHVLSLVEKEAGILLYARHKAVRMCRVLARCIGVKRTCGILGMIKKRRYHLEGVR